MFMTLEMQDTMNCKVSIVRSEIFVLLHRFLFYHGCAQHDVAAQNPRVVINKSEHIGRIILVAKIPIQLPALGFIHYPQHYLRISRERRLNPFAKVRPERDA
jgi:hypothetical protein